MDYYLWVIALGINKSNNKIEKIQGATSEKQQDTDDSVL